MGSSDVLDLGTVTGTTTPIDATLLLGPNTPIGATMVHSSPFDSHPVTSPVQRAPVRPTPAPAPARASPIVLVADERHRARKAPTRAAKGMYGPNDPPTQLLRGRDDHIDLLLGSVVDDTYEIEAKLGAGAMGVVYGARHAKLGKRFAIKVIAPRLSEDEAAVTRFEREARTLAQMHHPGIVDIHGFGELADGRSYFVMEYLPGETLQERLERGRVPFDDALEILDQLARALEAAHAHGVVHRDLKPGNTFLVRVTNEPRPVVKILDFGLAKLAALVDGSGTNTESGIVIGTALYLSPEQARGPDVDGRSDIYSLGCIAYELMLGVVPFPDARIASALIAAHVYEIPPLPRAIWPEIPPTLDVLLFGMLAKTPEQRPTLAQVRQVIARVRSASTTQRLGATLRVNPRGSTVSVADSEVPRSRNVVRIAVGLGAALTVGVIAAVVVVSTKPQQPELPPIPERSAVKPDDAESAPDVPPIAETVVDSDPEPTPDGSVIPREQVNPPSAGKLGPNVPEMRDKPLPKRPRRVVPPAVKPAPRSPVLEKGSASEKRRDPGLDPSTPTRLDRDRMPNPFQRNDRAR